MRIAIATTTIFPITEFLEAYTSNIGYFNRKRDVGIYIAGDRKSPYDSKEIASKYKQQGFDVNFLDIEKQRGYLDRFSDLAAIIPENSDNRRNVAYLMALEENADIVISVDDDNFPLPEEDFIGDHLRVGKIVEAPEAIGGDSWFNLCSLLALSDPDDRLYPRGFPYRKRGDMTTLTQGFGSGKVGVNVGLWTLDPDVDAIGRLYARPHVNNWTGKQVLLGRGIRSPINTQNTAISREAMTAYYYVRMGEMLRGMRLDRFGDIFSGYFLQVCADAVGDRIRIGTPVAEHRRNQHNLFLDLYNELAGIMLIEDLADFLVQVNLPGDSYVSAYRTLSYKLEDYTNHCEGFIWVPETKEFFKKICHYMRIWADVISSIL